MEKEIEDGEGMKDFGDVDDELSLEDINDELDDESKLDNKLITDTAISKCYAVIEWFENNTRLEIMAELIRRFKIDEDERISKYKK